MNKYETIFLMKDNLTKQVRQQVINKFREFLYENSKVTLEEDLGLVNLTYKIKNHNVAYYFLIDFEAESSIIQDLEKKYKYTDEILKFIVIKK